SRPMPQPSSATRISVLPPLRTLTSMRVAAASRAFSTSSFTTDAGRSTTSPAAIWFASVSGRTCMRRAIDSPSLPLPFPALLAGDAVEPACVLRRQRRQDVRILTAQGGRDAARVHHERWLVPLPAL